MQLRRSREARGLSQVKLARLMQYSDSYLSSIERAERNPTLELAQRADAELDTGGTLELMFWQIGNRAFIEGFPEYAVAEGKAEVIRLYERVIPHGLLQVPEYTAELERAAVERGSATAEQAAERAAHLQARQAAALERTRPPLIHAVLDESCLYTQVGGREVLGRQLAHLEELSCRPNVILQVAPFEMGATQPFLHAITLLAMPDGTVLGYTETHQRGYLERDKGSVAAWGRDYDRLQVDALSRTSSRALIRRARKELSHDGT
ncbi:Scr1 family TA system antitoxin-like transcriptional regulator [Kitasatospora sp. NPDC059646]|uniref:helix-turn-helix domain-containing protein n=1 Tax=Kitasatospora sp. NPDC059646 TaxID=3346893 RepID=UPI0036CA66E4